MANKMNWGIAYISKTGKLKLMKYRFATKLKATYAMGIYQGRAKRSVFTKVVKI